MNGNRLELLTQVRPTTTVDEVWTAEQQAALRDRILASAVPGPVPRPSRRKRNTAFAGAFAVGLLAVPGVAAAFTEGLRPQTFFSAYSYWDENPGGAVDASVARRVQSVRGPEGSVFSVVAAGSDDGMTCVAPLIETSASAAEPLPDTFNDGGSICQPAPDTSPFEAATVGTTDTAAVWHGSAGGATKAELVMPDGETYPVIIAEGHLFGWHPLPEANAKNATLTTYADDETVIYSGPLWP